MAMKAGIWFGLGLVVAGGSAMLAAQDARITMAKLPPAVQQTVKAQLAQGATLRGLSTDNEGGKPEYEAELT
ncbi:MAG: hypothetical protein ACRDOE_06150, partial [Streptosporangiaceae bacterium]